MQHGEDEAIYQDLDAALAEIERILGQMLTLAELSASDLSVGTGPPCRERLIASSGG